MRERINHFGLTIHNVKVLSAKYLEQYQYHRPTLWRDQQDRWRCKEQSIEAALEKFSTIYGKSASDVKLVGGVEFLAQYPALQCLFSRLSLDEQREQETAGGTYAEEHQDRQ